MLKEGEAMPGPSSSPYLVKPFSAAVADAIYADAPAAPGTLYGVLLRAEFAHARWSCGTLPPPPKGYTLVDRHDLSDEGRIDALRGCRIFAQEITEYVGEPLMMLVGPEERVCRAWLDRLQLRYRELPAPRVQELGAEWETGQLRRNLAVAERELTATFNLSLPRPAAQPLTAEALRDDAGLLHLAVSTSEPAAVSGALRQVFHLRDGALRLRSLRPLGAFSRRDEAILLSCCVAVAAKKLGRPVRCELWEDNYTRAPAMQLRCRWGLRDGRITALEVEGSYSGPTEPTTVLDAVPLLYDIPACSFHLRRVREQALFSGTLPEAALLGNAIELVLSRTAAELGRSEGELRLEQLTAGDRADSLARMTRELLTLSGYKKKKRDYARRQNQPVRRGISLAFAALQDTPHLVLPQPVMLTLRKSWRDSVTLLFDGAKPPRAANESLRAFTAAQLGLRQEQVILTESVEKLPALSESDAEALLLRGCEELQSIWRDGKEQELVLSSESAPLRQGWGVLIAETELDTATGSLSLPGLWCSCNTGRGAGVSETARLECGMALALPMTAPGLAAPAHLRPQAARREDALPERCSVLLPTTAVSAVCAAALEHAPALCVEQLPLTHPYLLSTFRQEGRI